MLALYRSGRQADALDVFHEARRVLSDSLALEPGPELRALQEAILAHDPAIAAVPVVPVRRGNLPSPATSFVGREAELAQVAAELAEHRIVTLLGPPGVGKTRIALEAARPLKHDISDGIWFVDLARAVEPGRRDASADSCCGCSWRRSAGSCGRAPARRGGGPPVRFVRAAARRGAARGRRAARRLSRRAGAGDEP